MSDGTLHKNASPRRIGRSVIAFIAGLLVGVLLSLGTDIALHAVGVFPALGQPMASGLLLIATAYRTVYGVASSYVMARLAPDRPMGHALAGGVVGLIFNMVAVVMTWKSGPGTHWYPLALAALTIPTAWAGGAFRVIQLRALLAGTSSSSARGLRFSN